MTIIIAGLSEVPKLVASRAPSHLITLLDPATMIETPDGIAPERHLKLGVNDIAEATEGLIVPDEALVARVLAFGATWDEATPMLIHCWAGISRSTASAFLLACERNPHVSERQIALAMRASAPHAFPNRKIVALADDVLCRAGRMMDAVEAMGEFDWRVAAPFDFAVRY